MTQIEKLIACFAVAKNYGGNISAEHDVIYFSGPPEIGVSELEIADATALTKLGAYYDRSCDSWSKFV